MIQGSELEHGVAGVIAKVQVASIAEAGADGKPVALGQFRCLLNVQWDRIDDRDTITKARDP